MSLHGKFNSIMYADDTIVFGNKEDFLSFGTDINSNLGIFNNWFKIDKLSLITEKNKLTIFLKKNHIQLTLTIPKVYLSFSNKLFYKKKIRIFFIYFYNRNMIE